MRTILSLLLMLLCGLTSAFAQLTEDNKQDNTTFIAVGVNQPFYNNGAFDLWTANHYNKIKNVTANLMFDFGIATKWVDFGVIAEIPSPVSTSRVYVGAKLFGHDKTITSWLNVEVGEMYANFSDIKPLNYTLYPDQIGQRMELHYNAGYIGLSLRNYLNFLHFNARAKHLAVPFNFGFYISGGITPFVQHWHYGYNSSSDDDDDGGDFIATRAYGIPKLSHYYVNTGLFMAL